MCLFLFDHFLNMLPTQATDPPKAPKQKKPTEPAPDRSFSTNSLHGDLDMVEDTLIK